MEDPAASRAWGTALGQLQLQVTRPNFETWLKDTIGLRAENGTFVIGTPSDFVSEWLSAKMGPVIAKTVASILGREVQIRFQVIGTGSNGHANGNGSSRAHGDPAPVNAATPSPTTASPSSRRLNPKLTFERFVVGESNHLAWASATAVAEQPAEAYNPLFIYGGSGLGKTHLLQAVAHRLTAANLQVIYATSEQFTNEFTTALPQGRQEEFRRKYRSPDALLLDDVQFLGGKDKTQEEFFHTFNDLHHDGRQVIVTSDCSPLQMDGLERRLCSRFNWGLLADIQPPDAETRLAILRRKAGEQGIEIAPDVEALLVDLAQDSVRDLEGLLNRVAAYARLIDAPITAETASQALSALTPALPTTPPPPQTILDTCTRYFNVTPAVLSGPSRAKAIAEARHVAMYLLREDAQLPLKHIGHLLGNRDHSTVIHACRKIDAIATTVKGHQQLNEIRRHYQADTRP
jgi:chromosomal replication initiator protein